LETVGGRCRGRAPAQWDESRRPITEFRDSDWGKKFHVWRMDWNADAIRLYVDDVLLNETDLSTTVNGNREAANPFHEPQYMLLNMAIGGRQGGDPTGTEFPARFEVDYVRVWQRPADDSAEEPQGADRESEQTAPSTSSD
jgi:beta-glucanase (GH16 family)